MKRKVNKKSSSSGNVIRTIFREELKNFATKNDLINLEKVVEKKFDSFETKIDFKFEDLERKVDEKAIQYRDQVLTSNDKLAKKLETMQQELELGNLQMRRQLEGHEERIVNLESAQKS